MADINARPPDEAESKRERRNGVLKRKKWRKKKGHPLGTPFDVDAAGLWRLLPMGAQLAPRGTRNYSSSAAASS